jgi:hypothetical protein
MRFRFREWRNDDDSGELMSLPSPLWAVILAMLGVVLALACLFHPSPENVVLAVLAISSNLVSGALGAFAGHASATSNSKPAGSLPAQQGE